MAGIVAGMKNFSNLGTAFSNNPALKAVQQAQLRKKAQEANQTAGVAGAASVSMVSPEASNTDITGLESRIAALESAPSSMSPQAIATGEAMFGNQDQRNNSINNPSNSALI